MIIPNIWENKHVPNHQPDYVCITQNIQKHPKTIHKNH